MSLLRALGIAVEGLTLNKVRSFLTMLGLIIGVAAVIIMMAVSHGARPRSPTRSTAGRESDHDSACL